jgi:hypothetical protein
MISSFHSSSSITSATPIPMTAASTAEEIMDVSYYSDYETYNPEEDDKLLDVCPAQSQPSAILGTSYTMRICLTKITIAM